MIVQDRVEGDVQDVGVNVRSDKHGADKKRMDTFFSGNTSIKAPLMLSLEPHTCTKKSRVRAT